MKLKKTLPILIVFVLFASITAFGQDDKQTLPSKERWDQVTIKGLITSIDRENRELVLKLPQGQLVTVAADERVKRFNEFEVGDVISAEYWTYIKAEFREPTPAERANPLVVLAEAGKAPEGIDPSAAVGAVVRALVTVDLINRTEQTVTLKGPRGKYLTIQVEDQNVINQVKVRDEIILTYVEALALSLEKAED